MPARSPTLAPLLVLAALLATVAGCGKSSSSAPPPGAGGPVKTVAAVTPQGTLSVSTRNTTRLGGRDVVKDAAAVARTVYPGLTSATQPQAAVVVSDRDWPAALAASVLSGAPLSAPILFSEGDVLPAVSRQTLLAMHPLGAAAFGGAQAITIATSPVLPSGELAQPVGTGAPANVAAAIARLLLRADGSSPPHAVIIDPVNAPFALQMPAAGLAAESGAPILFVGRGPVPAATASILNGLHRPSIYVLAAGEVERQTSNELKHFGTVTALSGTPPLSEGVTANAIAVARFTNGQFGWGVKEPGHGLVFANAGRPFDAPAAALLSATGQYGPLLLLESPSRIPAALASYLGDIQPAYTNAPEFRPVRGVYNHGWLIGDERAVTAVTQAEIDSLLEITERAAASEEPAGSRVE